MSALLTRKKMGAAEMATPASGATLFLLSDVQNNHARLGVVPVTLVVVTWML